MDTKKPDVEQGLEHLGQAASETASKSSNQDVQQAAQGVNTITKAAEQVLQTTREPSAETISSTATNLAGTGLAATEAAAGRTAATTAARAAVATASAVQSVAASVSKATTSFAAAAGAPPPITRVVKAVSEFLGGGEEPIHPVRFEFYVTVGPDLHLRVRKFRLDETLGVPYEVTVDLICDDPAAPIDELVGAHCELLIDRRDPIRALYGVIDEVEEFGILQERLFFRVRVVPALRLLEHEVDTRIFQGLDVKEILTEVLTPALAQYDRNFDADTFLKGTYNKRDYCTQFRETNLAFVCRLMEEEGIAFFFVPDEGGQKEKLILIDNNNDYGTPILVKDTEIPIIVDRFQEADRESFQTLEWKQRRRPNKIFTRGYNEKAPSAVDEATAKTTDPYNPSVREIYLHDDRRQIVEDFLNDDLAESFTGTGLKQREPLAKLTFERFRQETRVLQGTSNVVDLRPGVIVTVGQHPRDDIDSQRFLVIEAHHRGDAAESEMGTERQDQQFANAVSLIPIAHEFRPTVRHTKPRIEAQMATVVGPEGEEIYCDRFGRIRVRFPWERLVDNERSSCWMRVIQPWAGPSWGFVFIPRVGMEVIVTFLDGNPDRPVVTGSVYNGLNMPPYTLPAEKTKSVIKTSSSPGGDGYNELTFEDAAGEEQIIIHAQKDFNETVEHDHNTTVHNNQSIRVDVNQSTSVGGDQANAVTGNQNETVDKDVSIAIKGNRSESVVKDEAINITGNRSLGVKKDSATTVNGDVTETFAKTLTTTVGEGSTETITKGKKQTSTLAGDMFMISSGPMLLSSAVANSLHFDNCATLATAGVMTLTNGPCTITANGGNLTLNAADKIELKCGSASITLAKDGTVHVTGSTEAVLGSGGTAVTVKPTEAGIKSPKISSEADGQHIIKGAMVKIN